MAKKKNQLTNFKEVLVELEDGKKKKASNPAPMAEIVSECKRLTGGWPKSCNGELFYHDRKAGSRVDIINGASALLGLVGSITGNPPKFLTLPGFHKPGEFLSEMVRTAEGFDAIETMPHEPPKPTHYYSCEFPEPGNGESLLGLVKRFNPSTKADEDLILAAIATPMWGGAGGQCPAFLITSDFGRGAGKTQLVSMISLLYGGAIQIDPHEPIETIKQRLLSSDAAGKRIGSIDNIRSKKYASAGMESLITASHISGKKMYKGEHSIPNMFTFFFTVNGASLSKDLSQRTIPIYLDKPRYSPDWEDKTRQYIEEFRWKIIADIIAFLRSEPVELRSVSRWGPWSRDIIARLPEPEEVQKVISERQQTTDVDQEETQIVEDHFRDKLSSLDYDTNREKVFIPSQVATAWFNEATNEKLSAIKVSRTLGQWIGEESLSCIQKNACKSYGRGVTWVGPDWDCVSQVRTDLDHQIEIHRRNF